MLHDNLGAYGLINVMSEPNIDIISTDLESDKSLIMQSKGYFDG